MLLYMTKYQALNPAHTNSPITAHFILQGRPELTGMHAYGLFDTYLLSWCVDSVNQIESFYLVDVKINNGNHGWPSQRI